MSPPTEVELLQRQIDTYKKRVHALGRKLSKRDKTINRLEKQGTLQSGNFVILSPRDGKPTCSAHGAMLTMNKERTIWRCSTCHIGVDISHINIWIREEYDVTLIFNDKELITTIKTSRFKKALSSLQDRTT